MPMVYLSDGELDYVRAKVAGDTVVAEAYKGARYQVMAGLHRHPYHPASRVDRRRPDHSRRRLVFSTPKTLPSPRNGVVALFRATYSSKRPVASRSRSYRLVSGNGGNQDSRRTIQLS
jgi:hypothetical protein